MKQDFMFSCESVTEGHPDKLCDQISDAIVDRYLAQDPFSRVVAECAVANGIVFIATRFASEATVDLPEVARRVIRDVGYDREDFNARSCTVMTSLAELGAAERIHTDEATLDDSELERITATHMANAFGYACRQTDAMIPLPLWLAHKLARRLDAVRRAGEIPYLAPDAKVQVGVEFRNRVPKRIHSITLIASVHDGRGAGVSSLRADLTEHVVRTAFKDEPIRPDAKTTINVNPEGPVLLGGPSLHSGLTGRKNAIDTYGEYSRNSEAALSGKDPARIDRIGAYAARYAAKNVVAAGLAEECEVHLTYAIGQARPVTVEVETFGTGRLPEEEIAARVRFHLDLRPAGIVRAFALRERPAKAKTGFFRRLAVYGQVGRLDLDLPWERTDRVEELRGG